jgi:hypothetical protein
MTTTVLPPTGSPASVGDAVPMTAEIRRALEGLRDLQVRDSPAISSTGMEVVVLTLCVGVLSAVVAWWLWAKQPQWRARRRLARLRQRLLQPVAEIVGPEPPIAALREVADILRQSARDRVKGDPMPPGLTGQAFLEWLDMRAAAGDRGTFTGPAGAMLIDTPYMRPHRPGPEERERMDALFALCDRWLAHNLVRTLTAPRASGGAATGGH